MFWVKGDPDANDPRYIRGTHVVFAGKRGRLKSVQQWAVCEDTNGGEKEED